MTTGPTIQPVIAITLYRRPKYTRMLFDALEKCYGFDEIPCVIACDFSDVTERVREGCSEVWRLAQEFARKHTRASENGHAGGRAGVRLFQNDPRLGVDLNKLFVIPKAFEHGNFLIFLEDDTIPAPDALRYFCAMGEKHASDKTIFSISGYNRITAEQWVKAKQLPYGTNFARGFNPWGWATWRDRWDKFFGDSGQQYKNDTGPQANGLFDHWLNEKHHRTIVPIVARTKSVGGEDGEHTPNPEWHREHEYNAFGAWMLDLQDNGMLPWLDYAAHKYASPQHGVTSEIVGGACV